MIEKLQSLLRALRSTVSRVLSRAFPHPAPRPAEEAAAPAPFGAEATLARISRLGPALLVLALLAVVGWLLVRHPPLQPVPRGEVGLRVNQFTGEVTQWRDGLVLVVPGVHRLRRVPLRDRTWRPAQMALASGPAPVQSVEGLSVGIDLTVRYAVDPAQLALLRGLPADLDTEVVEPAVRNVVYKVFARYTVREIFSTRRAEIQAALETELAPRLAADGVLLRSVLVGKVDLPDDYRRGMEALLAEELATQKMRYTLELKDKRVKETELEAAADKVRREVRAEAAAREQVIAARAQEEAMKHVLPFKQRQVEQRRLEAEAERQVRLKMAEGSAQARRIEAGGEADARRQLADAEAFRLERLGQASAEQMAREGTLLSRHPLLIQKTLADKLSDKVQVIIAPPGAAGGFIGANLLGGGPGAPAVSQHAASSAAEDE